MSNAAPIFPLLEEDAYDITLEVAAETVEARLIWLQQCTKCSQKEFALRLMRKEPEDSFHATLATILKLKRTTFDRWLRMEKVVCAKKLCANWASLAKIAKHYNITLLGVHRNKTAGVAIFKFPHEEGCQEAGLGELCMRMAEEGFPRANDASRYNGIKVPGKAVDAAEHAMRKAIKGLK